MSRKNENDTREACITRLEELLATSRLEVSVSGGGIRAERGDAVTFHSEYVVLIDRIELETILGHLRGSND